MSTVGRPLFVLFVLVAIVASGCGTASSDTSDVPTLYVDLSDFKVATDHVTITRRWPTS